MKRVLLLGFVLLLSSLLLSEEANLVSKPPASKDETSTVEVQKKSRPAPKLDYYLSHSFLWASTLADERASAAYAGQPDSRCTEGTQFLATTDGRIRSGRYYAVNLGVAAPLTLGDYWVRRHYRVPWWYRFVADGGAVAAGSLHSYWAAQWVGRCRTAP